MVTVVTAFPSVTKMCRDGWEWIQVFTVMARDGSDTLWRLVGMFVKSAGTGGDGTKIPSLCTPLLYSIGHISLPISGL